MLRDAEQVSRLDRRSTIMLDGLAPGIERGRRRIGADGRDMDQTFDACLARRHDDVLRAQSMHGIKALRPALPQDSGIGLAQRRGDRIRVAQVGLHRMDLADTA